MNQYAEYDIFSVAHQIPGGMMGTFKAQLAQHNMMDKLGEVLEETARVRRELGYPGMATPFSQLVGIQAVLNIVTGKRYGTSDEDELIYKALLPAADIEKMRAAGPVKTTFPLLASPELDQVR